MMMCSADVSSRRRLGEREYATHISRNDKNRFNPKMYKYMLCTWDWELLDAGYAATASFRFAEQIHARGKQRHKFPRAGRNSRVAPHYFRWKSRTLPRVRLFIISRYTGCEPVCRSRWLAQRLCAFEWESGRCGINTMKSVNISERLWNIITLYRGDGNRIDWIVLWVQQDTSVGLMEIGGAIRWKMHLDLAKWSIQVHYYYWNSVR